MCTLLDSQYDVTMFPWIHQRYIARRIYRMKLLDVFVYIWISHTVFSYTKQFPRRTWRNTFSVFKLLLSIGKRSYMIVKRRLLLRRKKQNFLAKAQ